MMIVLKNSVLQASLRKFSKDLLRLTVAFHRRLSTCYIILATCLLAEQTSVKQYFISIMFQVNHSLWRSSNHKLKRNEIRVKVGRYEIYTMWGNSRGEASLPPVINCSTLSQCFVLLAVAEGPLCKVMMESSFQISFLYSSHSETN